MKWWLSKGNNPEGPFPAEHVTEWLKSGQISFDTLACPEGGREWKPLDETDEFAQLAPRHSPHSTTPPPPPPPPNAVHPQFTPGSTGHVQARFGVLTAAIVLSACAVAGEFLMIGDPLFESPVLWLLVLGIYGAATATWAVFHYGLWKLLPAEVAETTPGKAVGFLFIPCFNLYWVFRSYVGVNTGLNRLGEAAGATGPRANTGVATAAAVLFVVSWAIGLWSMMLPDISVVEEAALYGDSYTATQVYEEVFEIQQSSSLFVFFFCTTPNFILWLVMVLNQKRMVEYLVGNGARVNTASGLTDR